MAVKGHSVKFSYADPGTPTTYTAVAKVIDITPPNVEADDIDVSTMDSPDQFKEFTASWADGGECELTIQFSKQENGTIYSLFRADKAFKIEFSDGSNWTFNGYIKAFGNEVDREGVITTPITIKVSGRPTFTAAAA